MEDHGRSTYQELRDNFGPAYAEATWQPPAGETGVYRPSPVPLDGCTCGGIGDTGAHRRGCPWNAR